MIMTKPFDKTSEINTDCRSEIGITVGLIDSVISICRVLVHRDLSSNEVKETLQDLSTDEDLLLILEYVYND